MKSILPPREEKIFLTWLAVANANSLFHEMFPWLTAEQINLL